MISLLIPTFRRPDMLGRCLDHISAQTLLPDEIIVCVRDDDWETRQAVANSECKNLRIAVSNRRGVIAAMNAGVALTNGDVVALLDDDALARRDWLKRIVEPFQTSDQILGVGGLDLQDNPDQKKTGVGDLSVGTFAWYGRLYGNHHLGSGPARAVHVLKGCNCAYRGDFLRGVGFDAQLRGEGAQVGWEISLGLEAMKRGGTLIYDPSIIVDHKISPRYDDDGIHRGTYSEAAAFDIAWNQFSIIRRNAPRSLRTRVFLWDLLIGSSVAPGILRVADWRICPWHKRLAQIGVTLRAFQTSRNGNTLFTSDHGPNKAVTPQLPHSS